jgi:hypothetical protein
VEDAARVVGVEVRLVLVAEVGAEVRVAVVVEVEHLDRRDRRRIRIVGLRQSRGGLVAEGAVAVVDENLDPVPGGVRVRERDQQATRWVERLGAISNRSTSVGRFLMLDGQVTSWKLVRAQYRPSHRKVR